MGVLQGLPGQFQKQALLGVHVFGFFFRDAEKGEIEVADAVQNAGREGAGAARGGALRMQKAGDVEPVGGNLGDDVAPGNEYVPERVKGGHPPGKAAGCPDNSDLVFGHPIVIIHF
jgi:hypothetical protein